MLSGKIVEWLDHEQFLIFLGERKAGEVRHANGARENLLSARGRGNFRVHSRDSLVLPFRMLVVCLAVEARISTTHHSLTGTSQCRHIKEALLG